MRTHFTFISDPGHGWLLVKRAELAEAGLSEDDITPYSYQNGEILGLEEDVDAETFLAAYKAKMDREAEIIDDLGSCREWERFGTMQTSSSGFC